MKLVALMALLVVAIGTAAAAENVPVPPPRPAAAPAALPAPAAEIAEPAPPSACRLRLTAELAVAPSLPALSGPNECGAPDAVQLEAVVLADRTRVAVMPPATLRCEFAEAIVHWVREDIAPAARALGSALRSVDNYASYDCRGRNRVVGAKLSEHGRANALDVRLFRLADGKVLELTDPAAPRELRETLRKLTCARFTTVLGPGSDGYHENHVHVDLAPSAAAATACASGMCASPPIRPRPRPCRCRARVPPAGADSAAGCNNAGLSPGAVSSPRRMRSGARRDCRATRGLTGESPCFGASTTTIEPDLDPVVEVDHVLVGHADAARRDRLSDIFRLVGAVDAEQRVLAALVEIDAARAHADCAGRRRRDRECQGRAAA